MIFKLKDILSTMDEKEIGLSPGSIILSVTNVDDIFRVLRKRGIAAVKVDFSEMHTIVCYMVANAGIPHKEEEYHWCAIDLMQKGLVDSFFGVRLILEV